MNFTQIRHVNYWKTNSISVSSASLTCLKPSFKVLELLQTLLKSFSKSATCKHKHHFNKKHWSPRYTRFIYSSVRLAHTRSRFVMLARPALTRLWHTLRTLHAWVQHLLRGHEENSIGRLMTVHNLQFLHQEVHAPVRVLLPHLKHGKQRKIHLKTCEARGASDTLTSSMYSGSAADASQRLFRMKMLGLDRRSFTLWKKCFSFKKNTEVEEVEVSRGGGAVKTQTHACWPSTDNNSPCSSEWIQNSPPARTHQRPDRTYQSSCPAVWWHQFQDWEKNNIKTLQKTKWHHLMFESILSRSSWICTCPSEPGRLWAEHTLSWARTLSRDSQRPNSHPCAAREPADLLSAEEKTCFRWYSNVI